MSAVYPVLQPTRIGIAGNIVDHKKNKMEAFISRITIFCKHHLNLSSSKNKSKRQKIYYKEAKKSQ